MNAALAGLVILLIGDSHIAATGFFNNTLHDGLVAAGAAVHSFGVCNSAPSDWIRPTPLVCGRGERHGRDPAVIENGPTLRGWSLPMLIAQYNPNLVAIELGDNMAGYRETTSLPRAEIAAQVRQLLHPVEARNLPCVWIGPPWGTDGGLWQKTDTRVRQLSDYLSQIVSPCHYIDSLRFSAPGQWHTIDGVHLTATATRLWDNDLVSSIVQFAGGLPRQSQRPRPSDGIANPVRRRHRGAPSNNDAGNSGDNGS